MYKYPQNIFDAIRQERQDFLYNNIEIVDQFQFNQYNTIKKIHKYYNGHYNDGDYEVVNGIMRKKVFWSIGKRRATIATKQIDIDTKDFILIPEVQGTEWNVKLLEKDLKAKMRREKYSKILNQVADELPVYGSCVLRKTKEGAEVIDLRYFFVEQSADNLQKARYKIIKHFMTPEDMRKMDGTWDNVQEAIDLYAVSSVKSYETNGQLNIQNGTPYIEVYERFAEVPRSYLENDGHLSGDGSEADEDFVYARFICAGIDTGANVSITPDGSTPTSYNAPGLVLFKEEVKLEDDPFKEVHYRKTRGRWLGIGVIEDTFEDQRMVNKIKDQEDKASELASLILFQTAEDMYARNLITDVDNGEILKSKSPINRLDNTNRSLPEMQTIAGAWETHADRETFSADMLGGEQAPSSATLGAVNAQLATAASVYDYKKENFGIFLSAFIEDLVFPDIKRELMKPHAMLYTGDYNEMKKIRERVVDGFLRLQILESGDIPNQEEYNALRDQYIQEYNKLGSQMWIQVEQDFFKNISYNLSLEITGEGKNTQVWLNNLSAVYGLVAKNPNIMKDPVLKTLLFKIMAAMGMSVSELENMENEASQQQQMQAPQPAQQQPAGMQQSLTNRPQYGNIPL